MVKKQKGGIFQWILMKKLIDGQKGGHSKRKKKIKQKGGSAYTNRHGWTGWGNYWHPNPHHYQHLQRGGTSVQIKRNRSGNNWFFQRGGTAFPIKEHGYRVGGNDWFFKYRK